MGAVRDLAFRFLRSKASDGFLSFIAWVSMVGVALGVLALTVVTSVINGFEGELVRVITGANGDVILYSRGDPLDDAEAVEAKIRRVAPEVQQVTASFVSEMMVAGPDGNSGAVLEGIDPATVGRVTAIPERVVAGRLPQSDDEIALGSAVADRIGAKEGTEIRLIAPFVGEGERGGRADGSGRAGADAMSSQPKIIRAKVSGIVKMGMYEYDSKFVFATLPAVQKALNQPGRVTSFKMKLAPGANSRRVSDQLADSFGYPFRAKDWGQLNKNLLYAIQLEKAVIAIILTAIVIVAAFNVVSTLMMMIHDKTKEIAILKAMGFRPTQSFGLFVLIGMFIGTVGTAAGVGAGLGLGWILERTRLIDLPPDIYYIGFLPVVVRWQEVGLIALSALCITFLATLYPAIGVSRRPPLEGLRYE